MRAALMISLIVLTVAGCDWGGAEDEQTSSSSPQADGPAAREAPELGPQLAAVLRTLDRRDYHAEPIAPAQLPETKPLAPRPTDDLPRTLKPVEGLRVTLPDGQPAFVFRYESGRVARAAATSFLTRDLFYGAWGCGRFTFFSQSRGPSGERWLREVPSSLPSCRDVEFATIESDPGGVAAGRGRPASRDRDWRYGRRIRTHPIALITGAAAIVAAGALAALLGAPWYEGGVTGPSIPEAELIEVPGWRLLSSIDIFLVVIAAAAAVLVLVGVARPWRQAPFGAAALGLVAVGLIAYRAIEPPYEGPIANTDSTRIVDPIWGLWLALAAAVLLALTSALAGIYIRDPKTRSSV